MKKLMTMLLIFVFLFSIAASATNTDTANQSMDKQQKRMAIVEKLEAKGNFNMVWNNEKDSPRFISGNLSEKPVAGSEAAAQYMETNKALFNLENGKFQVKNAEKDTLGMTHYKMQYTVDGLPVYGDEMILHTDKDGNVTVINGLVDTNVPEKAYSKQIKLSAQDAIKAAEGILGFTPNSKTYTEKPKAETLIYQVDDVWQPVYLATLMFNYPYPANMKVFVNAENGTVVDHYNAIEYTATPGTGIGVLGDTKTIQLDYIAPYYYMQDRSRGARIITYTASNGTTLPGTPISDTDNVFNSSVQKAAVDAHYYMGKVYDYYKNNFGRNSYDGLGSDIISTVHYGAHYNNAYWDGRQMVYGDGDGVEFLPLSGAADIAGHEYTHAIVERTCSLYNSGQPGALNESICDMFGCLIEGNGDWLIGEDVYTPGVPGDALRSMSNPSSYGQAAHMNNYDPSGDTHINSGILNKAFYLAATRSNDSAGIAKIIYRAMQYYLFSDSQFIDAENALMQAAADLYGGGSSILHFIYDAFLQVGIDNYCEPSETISQAYPITSGATCNAYIAYSADTDYYKFTTSDPGNIFITLTNLPADYDLYLLNSAGTEIAHSYNNSTSNESISYTAPAAGTFYVKIVGFKGAYSDTQKYALKTTYPALQWYYDTSKTYDSPHNYTNNYNRTNTYTKPGATKVTVHFSRFETEAGCDYVYIKDKFGKTVSTHSGSLGGFWATVDGDTMNINLVTDYSVTAYGYHIDQVGYYSNGLIYPINTALGTDKAGPAPSDAAPINLGGQVIKKK